MGQNLGTDSNKFNNKKLEEFQLNANDKIMKKIETDMFSNDPNRQFAACQLTRIMLSNNRHPPIDKVINVGVIPRCVEFLQNEEDPDLQFEAAWVLTNIASGKQLQIVGAVEPLVNMLSSPYNQVAELAILALGNIARYGPLLRDYVINKGAIPPLVVLNRSSNSSSILRKVSWTLSVLYHNYDLTQTATTSKKDVGTAIQFQLSEREKMWLDVVGLSTLATLITAVGYFELSRS